MFLINFQLRARNAKFRGREVLILGGAFILGGSDYIHTYVHTYIYIYIYIHTEHESILYVCLYLTQSLSVWNTDTYKSS